MHATAEMIDEVKSLPTEERILFVDAILRTLNTPVASVDAQWVAIAKRRWAELQTGELKPIPGEEVFARILARYTA